MLGYTMVSHNNEPHAVLFVEEKDLQFVKQMRWICEPLTTPSWELAKRNPNNVFLSPNTNVEAKDFTPILKVHSFSKEALGLAQNFFTLSKYTGEIPLTKFQREMMEKHFLEMNRHILDVLKLAHLQEDKGF